MPRFGDVFENDVTGEYAVVIRGDEDASVLVEVAPLNTRFLEMLATLFGLANAGKTNAKGMPNPLQLALIGQEFSDVIVFTKPPRAVALAGVAPPEPEPSWLSGWCSYQNGDEGRERKLPRTPTWRRRDVLAVRPPATRRGWSSTAMTA